MTRRNIIVILSCLVVTLSSTPSLIAQAQPPVEWVQRAVDPGPFVTRPGLAYDSARGRVVLHGGDDGMGTSQATWEWDGVAWHDMTTWPRPGSGGGIWGPSMAYDSARGKVVLFMTDTANTAETWEWDGANWNHRLPSLSPPPMSKSCMVYDSARSMTLLLGQGNNGLETWGWDGSTWSQSWSLPVFTPFQTFGFGMAFDSLRGVLVFHLRICNWAPQSQTWEWDGSAWSGPFTGAPELVNFALTYHAGRGRTIGVFNEHIFQPNCSSSQFGGNCWCGASLYEWDGSTWTHLLPPPPMGSPGYFELNSMVYSGVGDSVLRVAMGTYELVEIGSTGAGQANTLPFAFLDVAGTSWAAGASGGPFTATLPAGGTGTVAFAGPMQPFMLFTGPLNPAGANAGCVGLVDIGTPPLYQDLTVVLDGTVDPTFTIGPAGTTHFTFAVPSTPGMNLGSFQGAVFQPAGSACPVLLTAAFDVTVQ